MHFHLMPSCVVPPVAMLSAISGPFDFEEQCCVALDKPIFCQLPFYFDNIRFDFFLSSCSTLFDPILLYSHVI
jgi:hypothetical protein